MQIPVKTSLNFQLFMVVESIQQSFAVLAYDRRIKIMNSLQSFFSCFSFIIQLFIIIFSAVVLPLCKCEAEARELSAENIVPIIRL